MSASTKQQPEQKSAVLVLIWTRARAFEVVELTVIDKLPIAGAARGASRLATAGFPSGCLALSPERAGCDEPNVQMQQAIYEWLKEDRNGWLTASLNNTSAIGADIAMSRSKSAVVGWVSPVAE